MSQRENSKTMTPLKLNINHHPSRQPDGTYRYSVGKVTPVGNVSSLEDELGNQLLLELPDKIVGSIEINRYKDILFLANNSIYIFNKQSSELILHCQLAEFNFDVNYPITGFGRIVRGCEDIVYFFDHINPDRYVNISRPEKQKTNGIFDISKFNFNPDIIHSIIRTEILNSGGDLRYGTYNFAIEYLTNNEDRLFVTPVDINYTPIIENTSNGGGLNLNSNLAEVGGKPNSKQSIKITVDNIPEDAELARIVVFRNTTGDGLTSDAHVVGELLQMDGEPFTYTYRGFSPDNGDYLVDKNSYLAKHVVYESSLHGLSVDNRQIRYNVKESVRDYSNYQQYASKVCVKYVVKEVSKSDPDLYLNNQTFIGGEIILPCINYIHKDGTISNAYPLVGRSKTASDEELIDDTVTQIGQVERWKYEDTSIKDVSPIQGYSSSGEFGYYESEQLYSNPPNFCQTDYWGTDCNGNFLLNTPVRLFVVPDRFVEPHDIDNNLRPIGIWFDESTIEYPNSDIVSHYFSITIVSKSNIETKGIGITGDIWNQNDNQYISSSLIRDINTGEIIRFHSGEYNINGDYVSGDYVCTEGHWIYQVDEEDEIFKKLFASGLPYDQIHIWNSLISPDGGFIPSIDTPIKVNETVSIGAVSEINGLINRNYTNDQLVIKSDDVPFDPVRTVRYISLKNYINPITNIWSIRTRRITDIGENVSFRGEYFISELVLDSIYDFKIEGIDIIESVLKFVKWGPFSFFIDQEGKDLDAWTEILKGFYTESKVNCNIRHLGTDTCNKHFQNSPVSLDYFLEKMIEPYENNHKLRGSFCKFFGGYNKDYSYISQHNKYLTHRFTYDFCSECTGIYGTRILYSLPSFQNDLSDNMRIFLPNNFIDVPSDTGSIIGVDYKDNKLIVRTEESCYFIAPNNQQLQLSESTINIGTGDFLSIPPQELNTVKQGYGGQQHKLDSINLEQGLVWADRERGEVYLLGGTFNEKTQEDMYPWFKINLPKNPDNHLLFTYDNYYKRLLMTKKNEWTISFCFRVNGWKSWHHYIPDWYLQDINTFYSVYNNKIWSHDSVIRNKFYDLNFDSTIELTVTDTNTFRPYSIYWYGDMFDNLIVYNDNQSTGKQNLILTKDLNIFNDNLTTYVILTDDNYKASPIKDLAASNVIWDNNIAPIKQGLNQGWTDRIPVIDPNKPLVEQGDFLNKWFAIRLINKSQDTKGTLHWYETFDLYSIR